MTVRVNKIFVYDGVDIELSAEGGSAKEALAIIDHEANELGVAPPAAAGKAPKAGGRKKADPAPAATPAIPALPPVPPTSAFDPGAPMHAPTGRIAAFDPAGAQPPMPPTTAFAPPAAPPGMPPAPPAFAPPPAAPAGPAPLSPEFVMKQTVMREYNDLLSSVPDAWKASVQASADGIITATGADMIGSMTLEQAEAAVKSLKGYRATCDATPRTA